MKKKSTKHKEEPIIPLSSNDFKMEDFKHVIEETYSQHFFNDTSKVGAFELALANKLCTTKEVVCLSSGTAAIHLALLLAGIKKGDYVICQTFTYVASVNPVLYLGAKPVFIDSNRNTWNMDIDLLEEALFDLKQKGIYPKAIIAVNIYGMPSDMKRLVEISQNYNIKLIEDSAESLGAKFDGNNTGTLGNFGILSFNNNKILSTGGGGGLICKDEKVKEKALFYANQAREKLHGYSHQVLGYNYRFSNIQAILGLSQLNYLEDNIIKRREVNQFYQRLFNDFDWVEVFTEISDEYESNHWLSCILINEELANLNRDELQKILHSKNIETRLLWKPMHLQPLFKNNLYYGRGISEELCKKGLCLPSGSNLTQKDKERISKVFKSLLS